VTDELIGCDVIGDEIVSWREVVVRDEMACLGNGKVFKVVACSPVATIEELVFSCCEILDPVNLARLRPEVLTTLEI